jgi:hypothetical protein
MGGTASLHLVLKVLKTPVRPPDPRGRPGTLTSGQSEGLLNATSNPRSCLESIPFTRIPVTCSARVACPSNSQTVRGSWRCRASRPGAFRSRSSIPSEDHPRASQDLLLRPRAVRRRSARTGLVLQSLDSLLGKASAPLSHRVRPDSCPLGNHAGGVSLPGSQDEAGPLGESLFGGRCTDPPLQRRPLLRGLQLNTRSRCPRVRSSVDASGEIGDWAWCRWPLCKLFSVEVR